MVNMNTIIGLVAFNFIFISNKYKAKKMGLDSPTGSRAEFSEVFPGFSISVGPSPTVKDIIKLCTCISCINYTLCIIIILNIYSILNVTS